MKKRLVVVLLLWTAVAVLAVRSWRSFSRHRAVQRACAAVEAGEYATAIRDSERLVSGDAHGLAAGECRAWAQMLSGDLGGGVETVERLLRIAEDDRYLPAPELTASAVVKRRSEGRLPAARNLVRRATAAYPQSTELFLLELDLRRDTEDEDVLLAELTRRLPEGSGSTAAALELASRWLDADRPARAQEVLGADPPQAEPGQVRTWFILKTRAFGMLGDVAGLNEHCRRWIESGEPRVNVMAYHGLTLSQYSLQDPYYPAVTLLEEAAKKRDELTDPGLLEPVLNRLVAHLIVDGHHQKALLYADEAEKLGIRLAWNREEILRSASGSEVLESDLQPAADETRRGVVRFRLADAPDFPARGAALWASPGPREAVDADYQRYDFEEGGVLRVERLPGIAPLRWVLADGDGRTRASGTVWPAAGESVEVGIHPGKPSPRETPSLRRRSGDGRRRVFVVVLDCADWRLLQYLRARGEMPVLDHLLRHGYRAVVESRPAFTAAAMKALAFPDTKDSLSPVGVVHSLGAEIAGLNFVGRNPFSALGWLLPERPSLFEAIGAGEHVAVNLLFAEGGIEAGRHGEMLGPRGRRRTFTRHPPEKPLARSFEAADEQDRILLEEAAADFDTLLDAVGQKEIDFLMLRVASLDIATHRGFPFVSKTAQDDGTAPVFSFYRYLDLRLGELQTSLDQDDVLVVMSDHGIRTGMEHDPRSVFVAVGPGIPPGRAPGMPPLRGVPRLLAHLAGVETDWPASGMEGWPADGGGS